MSEFKATYKDRRLVTRDAIGISAGAHLFERLDYDPMEWHAWLDEADELRISWEHDKRGKTIKALGFVTGCWNAYNTNKVTLRTKVTPWLRRKVNGRWEPYWYALWGDA